MEGVDTVETPEYERKKSRLYCCVINCSNHTFSTDPRTGKQVKLHKFPDHVKEKERCQRWLVNVRRADLHLNIKFKKVCSTHFENTAYNCPADISSSPLLPNAVPTIVNCPNPPKPTTSQRKPPAKRKCDDLDFGGHDVPATNPPPPKKPKTEDNEAVLHVKLNRALLEIEKLKREKRQLQRQLKRSRTKCVNTELAAKKHVSKRNEEFVDSLLKKLPSIPSNLFQILLKKTSHVSNWTKEKDATNLCMSVYFRSSSAYNVLRSSGFILPYPRTLQRRYSDVLQSPGLCPKLLEMLRLRAQVLSEHEKCVTLSLDGMTVQEAFMYKSNQDKIVGCTDYGKFGMTDDVANQGVLIMVRGLSLSWKQIVGYYITRHSISAETLDKMIQDAVSAISSIGLRVSVIVMDQEASQWKWVRSLGVSSESPATMCDMKPIFIVPDPPHLIKNLRNNFMSKDIQFTLDGVSRTAKFKYLSMLYNIDSQSPLRLVPRWTQDYFELPRGKKMKVMLACQIFSHTASRAIQKCVSSKLMPEEALDTAVFFISCK